MTVVALAARLGQQFRHARRPQRRPQSPARPPRHAGFGHPLADPRRFRTGRAARPKASHRRAVSRASATAGPSTRLSSRPATIPFTRMFWAPCRPCSCPTKPTRWTSSSTARAGPNKAGLACVMRRDHDIDKAGAVVERLLDAGERNIISKRCNAIAWTNGADVIARHIDEHARMAGAANRDIMRQNKRLGRDSDLIIRVSTALAARCFLAHNSHPVGGSEFECPGTARLPGPRDCFYASITSSRAIAMSSSSSRTGPAT